MFRALLCLFLLSITSQTFAQLPNDACSGALHLGTLIDPAPCPSGIGTPEVFSLSNIGAVAESPYSSMSTCSGDSMASPASDIWVSFVASGPRLDVTVTGGLIEPNIGMYMGTCGGLIPSMCNVGSGTATFYNTPGQTYYMQISGQDTTDVGNFDVTLSAWKECCLQDASISATPPPHNGTYAPNTTVTFCVQIDSFFEINTNWLKGVLPSFGSAWDTSTLVPGTPPATLQPPGSIWSNGEWIWTNNVVYHMTGLIMPEYGWYFDSERDGNPGNDYGDASTYGTQAIFSGPWQPFCFSITTKGCDSAFSGESLNVTANTFADGEVGSWNNVSCVYDDDLLFEAVFSCCYPFNVSTNDVSCSGFADGSITASITSGSPWDVTWQDTLGNVLQSVIGTTVDNTLSNLAPGSYTLTIGDDSCTHVQTIVITESVLLTLDSTTASAFCGQNNGTATVIPIGGTGPYTYLWPDLSTNPTHSALAPGTHTIDVTDANGCTAFILVVIGQVAQLNLTETHSNATCGVANGVAAVMATGGLAPYTYLWPDLSTNPTHSALAPGTHTIDVTDANGCTASISVVIGQTALPSLIETTTPSTCSMANGTGIVTVTGGSAPFTYLWPDASTNAFNTGLFAGTYMVYVTDLLGCTDSIALTVNDQPGPVIDSIASVGPTCFGLSNGYATVYYSGGTGGITFQWDDPFFQVSQTAIALPAGILCVTIIDANGCSAAMCDSMAATLQLAVTTSATDVSCAGGTDGTAASTASGGLPPYSFDWGGADPNALAAGYQVFVLTDDNGCVFTDSVLITEPTAMALSGWSTPELTANDGSCTLSVSGGTAPYSYLWSNAETTQNITNLATGIYTVVVTDASGCVDSLDIFVDSEVGLGEPQFAFQVVVYPNPASQELHVQLSGLLGNTVVNCYDASGRLVLHEELGNQTEQLLRLDVSGLSAGIYTMVVVSGEIEQITRYSVAQ